MATTIHRKINVLEVNSSLIYAGGQRNMVSFAKYFRRDLFDVTVGIYGKGGPLETMLNKLSIPYVIAEGNIDKLIEVIVQKKIDVMHIHRSGGAVPAETLLIQKAKQANPDLVIVEKNVFGKFDPSTDGLVNCSFFQSMMHIHERFLPASGKTFDFERMKVMYNIVDREEFSTYTAKPGEIEEYKKAKGIKTSDFVVGKVARPGLEKWSDLLIDMMPYLVSLMPNIKVVIIGPPLSRIDRIKKSKYASYFVLLPSTNNQKELHLFYQAIDVLAHSSKIGECNGNTINEAMYWKKPVVVNSTPRKDNGQLEQVIHDVNGFVANTPPTFARAIAAIAQDPKISARLGKAGHDQVQTVNDPRVIVSQLEKFLLEIIAKRSEFAGLSVSEEYAKIQYHPTREQIIAYRQEYRDRLRWDYGSPNTLERFFMALNFPRRFFYKLKDFIDHKWASYAKR